MKSENLCADFLTKEEDKFKHFINEESRNYGSVLKYKKIIVSW